MVTLVNPAHGSVVREAERQGRVCRPDRVRPGRGSRSQHAGRRAGRRPCAAVAGRLGGGEDRTSEEEPI
jgi:hypothetical protein